LVSTFKGANNTGDWPSIKAAISCFFIPSWTSMGPSFANHLSDVDGACRWGVWPGGASDKNTSSNEMWINMLGGKPYMMGVSPWFYTIFPNGGKTGSGVVMTFGINAGSKLSLYNLPLSRYLFPLTLF